MKKALVPVTLIVVLGIILAGVAFNHEAEWSGVDEAVVSKYAEQAGRPPAESFIKGDALLFFFLIAGAAGGFTAGYYFRGLFPPEQSVSDTTNV
jgi:hypothetical protein